MALFAKATECAPMYVICAVTPNTASRKADPFLDRFLVARMAVESLMRTVKTEFRSLTMIKVPFTPVSRVVTLLAQ
jgi:hypothetical protein